MQTLTVDGSSPEDCIGAAEFFRSPTGEVEQISRPSSNGVAPLQAERSVPLASGL